MWTQLKKIEDKTFHYTKIHLFDRRILLPNGAYKIPEVTDYMLFTMQKTFFSPDALKSDFQIPFPVEDPVVHQVTRLENNLLDFPPQTMYIDDERDDNDDYDKMPPPPPQPCTSIYFLPHQQEPSTSSYFPPQKRARTEAEKDFDDFLTIDTSAFAELRANTVSGQSNNFSGED